MSDDAFVSSSFVMVDAPQSSSWILVPDPKVSREANMTDASKVRWQKLDDAQAATTEAARRRELQALLEAQSRSRGNSTLSNESSSNASFLPADAAEALRSAFEAEQASVQRRDRETAASEAAALQLEQQQRHQSHASGAIGTIDMPRRCDCLGASANIHRSNCPAAATAQLR